LSYLEQEEGPDAGRNLREQTGNPGLQMMPDTHQGGGRGLDLPLSP